MRDQRHDSQTGFTRFIPGVTTLTTYERGWFRPDLLVTPAQRAVCRQHLPFAEVESSLEFLIRQHVPRSPLDAS